MVLVGTLFAAPAAADPDEIIDALLTCKPDFFEVLKTEKSAFMPALLTQRLIPVAEFVESMASVATFQQAIMARGLRVEVYLQTVISGASAGSGDMRTHIWGVLVPDEPQEVIKSLEANVPGAKFEPLADGWMMSPENWERPDPWSLLLIRRYQDKYGMGSSIWCFAETAALKPMQGLPSVEDLLWKY
ncbi:hypothetical protein EHS39_15695 [Ensifer sp. MPMI2T]|nr:hypothetical protein EHS39_15695 [Ensifer sp. MPMI2T]